MEKHVDAEIRMFWWMSGTTEKEKKRNEDIIDNIGVAPIEDNIRENCLRWFGHVYRRPEQAVVRRSDGLQTFIKSCRPKKIG